MEKVGAHGKFERLVFGAAVSARALAEAVLEEEYGCSSSESSVNTAFHDPHTGLPGVVVLVWALEQENFCVALYSKSCEEMMVHTDTDETLEKKKPILGSI